MTLPDEMARERLTEDWLLQKVGLAYDALKADPSRARSAAEVRESLASAAPPRQKLTDP